AVEAEQPEEAAEDAEPITPFSALIQSLATQCLFALGVIAPQDAKQVTLDIVQAKYVIDTLLMLREKTEGNLTEDEETTLGEAIAELQRIYVVRAQQAQESALQQSGIDMNNLKDPQG
ncbi:MAG: DUF1844 domain-containing protein, partial [bacterium]|nr:DUF1844 domain-containing protein [bacterium]